MSTEAHIPPTELEPDERPQRRREYSGALQTLGLAAAIVLVVGAAIWWFELRGAGGNQLQTEGFGVVELADELNPTGQQPASEVGRAAPNFRLRAVRNGEVSLADYRGNWVLLNFWAAWCPPCRQETPTLQAFANEHPEGLVVLGVNQQEAASVARDFIDEYGVTYPTALDLTGEVSVAYRVSRGGLPASLLIDPEGVIREIHLGQIREDDLAALAAEYLR
ncbi:MAG: TlpA family protein disulfide reductase [Dehalococcoidia bacterium]|nr:TlpA family protein disulfide reductase [Dehalococcoidia bacterium]